MGDPTHRLAARNPAPSAQAIAVERERLLLDRPALERYRIWMAGLGRGDLGPSVHPARDIGSELGRRLGRSGRLVATATTLALLLTCAAGMVGAYGCTGAGRAYLAADRLLTVVATVALALPGFWLALLLAEAGIAINAAAGTLIVPTVGDGSAAHLVLPSVTLAITMAAAWSRHQRAALHQLARGDVVRLARAKGLPRHRTLRHALRAMAAPLVTVSALDIGTLVAGAVAVEAAFQWRGMGDFLVTAVAERDAYAVRAWLVVAALGVTLCNLTADLLSAALDPRVREDA